MALGPRQPVGDLEVHALNPEGATMARRSLLLALLAATAACPPTVPESPDLNGEWSGATDGGNAATLNLSHDLSTDRLSGTWSLRSGDIVIGGTVDGHLTGESVSLDLNWESRPDDPARYTGAVADGGTTLRGTITYDPTSDPGDSEPLVLTKG